MDEMSKMTRRDFLKIAGLGAAAGVFSLAIQAGPVEVFILPDRCRSFSESAQPFRRKRFPRMEYLLKRMITKWKYQHMDMIVHNDIGAQFVASTVEMPYRLIHQGSLLKAKSGLVSR